MKDYKNMDDLKTFCEERRVRLQLRNAAVLLRHIANDFESDNKDIDEISIKAGFLEKEISQLRELIINRVITQ